MMDGMIRRRMWRGGPLIEWSASKGNSRLAHASGGYVGSYICDQCEKPAENGVYRTAPGFWVCEKCKNRNHTGQHLSMEKTGSVQNR